MNQTLAWQTFSAPLMCCLRKRHKQQNSYDYLLTYYLLIHLLTYPVLFISYFIYLPTYLLTYYLLIYLLVYYLLIYYLFIYLLIYKRISVLHNAGLKTTGVAQPVATLQLL